jgi:hypothetical protein
MSDFVLQVLEFGVLGLCALTLILVWRVLQAEQERDGDPRPAMIRASYMFMSFAVALAILNGCRSAAPLAPCSTPARTSSSDSRKVLSVIRCVIP